MADLAKTISVLFKGVDEVSDVMDTISERLSKMGAGISSATQPFADLASAVEKLDAALAAIAIGGIVTATTAAGKFQSGMNEIHTLLRESPEAVSAFDKAIESYAVNSTQSLEDIQKAIYQANSANVDYKDSVQFVTDAEKLAIAGKSTLTEAVDLLTGTMTAYGASWNQASQYSDTFFKTVEIGKVTIPELSQSLSMVTPIAASSGISINEVSAAVAGLTAGGMKAGPAAEYLRQVITDLVKPAEKSKETFDSLGIAYGGNELAAKGLSGKLQEIYEKTGGNIDVMAKLFGNVQSLSSAMTLGKDASGYYAKALTALAESAGSTDLAYSKMVDNLENINNRLMNSMKLALVEVGKPLLDDWNEIASSLSQVFQQFKVSVNSGAFDDIYAAFESFSSSAGTYLKDIAKALPEALDTLDFSGLLDSLKGLGSAVGDVFKALFGDYDLTKPEEAAAAIQKIIDALTKLTEFSTGIAESLKPFATSIGEWIDKWLSADTETTKLAGSVAGFGQAINSAISILELMGPALAILSGATIVNAIASVGSLAAGLAAFAMTPVGGTIVGLGLLAAAAYVIYEKTKPATDSTDALAKAIEGLKIAADPVQEKLDSMSQSIEKLPGCKDIIFEAQIDTAQQNIETMSSDIAALPAIRDMSFEADIMSASANVGALKNQVDAVPTDLSLSAQLQADSAESQLQSLIAKINEIPAQSVVEVLANSQQVDALVEKIDGKIPALKNMTVQAELQNTAAVDNFMSEISKTYPLTTTVTLDQASVTSTKNQIKAITNADGTITYINVGVDKASMQKAQNDLKEIPTKKQLEIKLKGEIDKDLALIKTSAETVQASMEWKAKVDIADIQAKTETIKSSLSSVTDTITSATDEIAKLFENMPDSSSSYGASEWKKAVEQATELQSKEYEMQKSLVDAQIDLIKQKKSAMQSGEGLIKIDSSGLEPALEEILWQVLDKVQIRAAEEAGDFLLGL